jgi:hypothetical protein
MSERSRPNSTIGDKTPSFTSTYNNAKDTYQKSDRSKTAQDTFAAAVLVWREEKRKMANELRWKSKTDDGKHLSQARSQLARTIEAQKSEAPSRQ